MPEFFDACDHCGEPFETNTTYPVLTPEDDADTMQVYSFCDDQCLSSWREAGESIDDRERDRAEA